jgi:hypothetical protein
VRWKPLVRRQLPAVFAAFDDGFFSVCDNGKLSDTMVYMQRYHAACLRHLHPSRISCLGYFVLEIESAVFVCANNRAEFESTRSAQERENLITRSKRLTAIETFSACVPFTELCCEYLFYAIFIGHN